MRPGIQRLLKRAIAGFLALWLLLLQVPIALPVLTSGDKDLSIPFPCMHRACGCRSAAQCWKSCCCTTREERIAFAQAHGTPIPGDALQTPADSEPAKRECCSTHPPAPGPDADSKAHRTDSGRDVVVLISALRCRGLGMTYMQFAGIAVAIPPADVPTFESLPIWVTTTDDLLLAVESVPPTPPPRLAAV